MAEGCASRPGRARGRLIPAILAASLAAAVAFRVIVHGAGSTEVRRSFPAMGTIATVVIVTDARLADSIADAAWSLVGRLDADLDPTGLGSLGRLNATGSCIPSPDLMRLVETSRTLTTLTGGRFDPTVRPLVELWGFEGTPRVPDSASIDSALALCGWDGISFDSGRLTAHEGSGLDLGAIAAGYAADRVYELAVGMGADAALVDMGGEIRCGGRLWRIAVQDPCGDGYYTVLEMEDGAVSTSGGYENFFEDGGRIYSHIIDPSTGYPADIPASVTVAHSRADAADALSTAFAVSPPASGDSLLGARGVLVLLEDSSGALMEIRHGSLD